MGLPVLGASSEVHPELAATRTTGAPAGDSTPCRGSARARGILRGSPRACCDPNHGSSCMRLHSLPACDALVQGRQLPQGIPRDYLRGKIKAFSRLSRHFDLEFALVLDLIAVHGASSERHVACCDPNHGSSCVRLRTLPSPCRGSARARGILRASCCLLRPEPRELVHETPLPTCLWCPGTRQTATSEHTSGLPPRKDQSFLSTLTAL